MGNLAKPLCEHGGEHPQWVCARARARRARAPIVHTQLSAIFTVTWCERVFAGNQLVCDVQKNIPMNTST